MEKDIILASNSPRRRELLKQMGYSFKVIVEPVEEVLDLNQRIEENVKELARKKANAVFNKHPHALVIGADTMVVLKGKMMGKPRNEEEACKMLKALSGKEHEVYTGVALLSAEKNETFFEMTKVKMQRLTDEEISTYIETKEPFDKAGSYAIQGIGAKFIEGITGDYFNVVGLPIHALYTHLKNV